jgi:hypothetical protein
MISKKEEGRLEYIDVVRWQDGEIHVLGRKEENISSDGSFYSAYHIIHDALTGCYILSCEGECPPFLNHELALKIHENKINADKYDSSIRKFKEANLNDLRKIQKT